MKNPDLPLNLMVWIGWLVLCVTASADLEELRDLGVGDMKFTISLLSDQSRGITVDWGNSPTAGADNYVTALGANPDEFRFTACPGGLGEKYVAIESIQHQCSYLRHSDVNIWLHPATHSELTYPYNSMARDSCFQLDEFQPNPDSDAFTVTFETYNYPGAYLVWESGEIKASDEGENEWYLEFSPMAPGEPDDECIYDVDAGKFTISLVSDPTQGITSDWGRGLFDHFAVFLSSNPDEFRFVKCPGQIYGDLMAIESMEHVCSYLRYSFDILYLHPASHHEMVQPYNIFALESCYYVKTYYDAPNETSFLVGTQLERALAYDDDDIRISDEGDNRWFLDWKPLEEGDKTEKCPYDEGLDLSIGTIIGIPITIISAGVGGLFYYRKHKMRAARSRNATHQMEMYPQHGIGQPVPAGHNPQYDAGFNQAGFAPPPPPGGAYPPQASPYSNTYSTQ